MQSTTGLGWRPLIAAVALAASTLAPPAAQADSGNTVVFPGMEIRQGTNLCTLGFVDVSQRVAYSAGHCRAPGPVTDRAGRPIGVTTSSRSSVAQGAVITTDQPIVDYQRIALNPGVTVNDVLPDGRVLESGASGGLVAGAPFCHIGVVTGESCGTVERVNNRWFTMTNGVVSQHGDSGGPVYVPDGDRAVLVGLFNSTWGSFPAAVFWPTDDPETATD